MITTTIVEMGTKNYSVNHQKDTYFKLYRQISVFIIILFI